MFVTCDLPARIIDHFVPPPPRLAVAVSGGSDSLALLSVLATWQRQGGPALQAVTVDHGLREEAAAEARYVGAFCAGQDIPHTILHWHGWDGQGNLQDHARRARYGLIAEWAEGQDIGDIAVAHTADDQAETFLMRLAREAGLDGLSAMAPVWMQGGVRFHRPCLAVSRPALRDWLKARDIRWIDDPSNADTAFERVRARQVLEALAPLEITARGLARVAQHLADARSALSQITDHKAGEIVALDRGDIVIDRPGFDALPWDMARRLLQAALMWISGADYPPRGRALETVLAQIREGRGSSLQGCLIRPGKVLRLSREWQAVATRRTPFGGIWDGRWQIAGPAMDGAEIAALGEAGLAACPDRAETGLPAASLMASPALWRGPDLLSAPLAGYENGWQALLRRDRQDFSALL